MLPLFFGIGWVQSLAVAAVLIALIVAVAMLLGEWLEHQQERRLKQMEYVQRVNEEVEEEYD